MRERMRQSAQRFVTPTKKYGALGMDEQSFVAITMYLLIFFVNGGL